VGNKKNWAAAAVPLTGLKEAWQRLRERREAVVAARTDRALAWGVERAGEIADRYRERKRLLGALDFDDLLVATRDLLDAGPAVTDPLREQYRYLLVDEFQDTDPLQADIILRLAEAPGESARRAREAVRPGRLPGGPGAAAPLGGGCPAAHQLPQPARTGGGGQPDLPRSAGG
jgi:ATP-dependent helicase/nuclease subunit A